MADVVPDYHVSIQRVRTTLATLRLNLERFKLEIMEMRSKKRQAIENIEATEKAVAEHEFDLEKLLEEHGEPPPLDMTHEED